MSEDLRKLQGIIAELQEKEAEQKARYQDLLEATTAPGLPDRTTALSFSQEKIEGGSGKECHPQ